MKFLFVIIMVLLFDPAGAGAQISPAFHQALPERFKPEDPAGLTLAEKAALLAGANVEFHLKAFTPELDEIARQLYLDIDKMSSKKDRVKALGAVAIYTRGKGNDPELALKHFNRLIEEIDNDTAFSVELCESFIVKGTLLLEKGEMEGGVTALQEARKIILTTENTNEERRLGYIYATLSNAYIQLELYDQAVDYINMGVPYFKDVKPEQVKDLLLNLSELNRATAYIGSFQLKNHSAYMDTAVTIVKAIMKADPDDPRWLAPSYGLLGKISYLKKEYQQSARYLDSADLPAYASADISGLLPERTAFRGLNLLRNKKIKEGNALIRKAINLYNENYSPLSFLYYQLYEVYRENGDWENASAYLKKYIDKKDSENIIQRNLTFADINEKYRSAQKEAQINQLQTDREIQKKQQRLTILLAIIAVLSLLLIIILIYLFTRKKQQALERENLQISQSLVEQEAKMLEEKYESLRTLRLKISNDMHNELGSALVSLNFYINDIQSSFSDKEIAGALNNIKEEASSIYIQTREYIHDLQHSAKDIKFDLVNFLLYLPLLFSQSTALQIQTDIAADELEAKLSIRQNNEFYLFIKEALANILKHSNATYFAIKIDFQAENCTFSISDNGKGFNPDSETTGIGIKNMKERIAGLGGELTIASGKKGTVLSGYFPVKSPTNLGESGHSLTDKSYL